ncbi:hypothetical protein C8J57DRAFT_253539 [Mycena rebaudengoi]|nr:hypothetical protein C8J57DRAFT_253539 [Mycena rebaudengoi]
MDTSQAKIWTGVLLAASWINVSMYTLEIILVFYYLHLWKPKQACKWALYSLLVCDALSTIVSCSEVFMIILWFGGGALPWSAWPFPARVILTGLAASIERAFFIRKQWTVMRSLIISGFLVLIATSDLALTLAAVTMITLKNSFASLVGKVLPMASAALSAGTDTLIAIIVVWSLSGVTLIWRSTPDCGPIRMIFTNIVASGILMACLTLTLVLLMASTPAAPYSGSLFLISGRLYSLGVLVHMITCSAPPETVPDPVSLIRRRRQTIM